MRLDDLKTPGVATFGFIHIVKVYNYEKLSTANDFRPYYINITRKQ